jgi:hypothetical protein
LKPISKNQFDTITKLKKDYLISRYKNYPVQNWVAYFQIIKSILPEALLTISWLFQNDCRVMYRKTTLKKFVPTVI